MLKIIHIIPTLGKGGAERLVLNICNELQKKEGVQVKLVVLSPINEYEFLSKELDLELCNSNIVPSISGKFKINISAFEKIIADYKPQIIHSHLFEAEMVSRWKLFPEIRYFTHCHDNMAQFKKFDLITLFQKKSLTNFYERQLLLKKYNACNNNFIVISKNTEDYFKKNLPKKFKKNIVLLNNAIDFTRFKFLKNDFTLNFNKAINLITIGSLRKIKNHLFLIDVLNILNKKGVYNLIIIGEGPMRLEIEKKIIEYQLQDKIKLIGLTDKVEDYLRKADLYIYSCIKEGFGLSLLEAMATSLPVVSLDGKGNCDFIENDKNGFIINENNPKLFANKIIEIIQNKELYHFMSNYAIESASKYNIENYVEKLLSLYTSKFNNKKH